MYTKEELLQFLKDLASGLDPNTGEVLDDDHLLNNPIVIRKLYGVIGILESKDEKKAVKKFVVPKDIDDIITDENLTITNIIAAVNEKMSDNVKRVSYNMILLELIERGYLYVNAENKRKCPTEKGIKTGISIDRRYRYEGHYYEVVVYNKDAQRLVVEIIKEKYSS